MKNRLDVTCLENPWQLQSYFRNSRAKGLVWLLNNLCRTSHKFWKRSIPWNRQLKERCIYPSKASSYSHNSRCTIKSLTHSKRFLSNLQNRTSTFDEINIEIHWKRENIVIGLYYTNVETLKFSACFNKRIWGKTNWTSNLNKILSYTSVNSIHSIWLPFSEAVIIVFFFILLPSPHSVL